MRIEYTGTVTRIESVWEQGIKMVRLTIELYEPTRPVTPNWKYATEEEKKRYNEKMAEYKKKLRSMYGFTLNEVKLIQEVE